jgi:ribosome-associated protein YbcJ (S4-like RNA binding protein)
MSKPKIDKFGLAAIQKVLINADIETARKSLAFAVGASVDVSGAVLKRIKRDNQCKLFIAPDNARLTVFADCESDVETVIGRKIRKGSKVSITGKLLSFGYQSVHLSGCRLQV